MTILALAPMAGLTDRTMRTLCYRYGADQCTTEMVSAMGYVCAKRSLPVYEELLDTDPTERDTRCQLFGRDESTVAEAAMRISGLHRFTAIDFNMGCPAKKVVSSGEGSALLKDVDKAVRLLEALKRATDLPVTVKLRLGFDSHSMNVLPIAQAAQALGYAQVAVHGRTREQQYGGHADWDAIGRIARELTIPLLANGDVATPEDAVAIRAATGCAGVMIGRAAIGNPFLFRDARLALDGLPYTPPTPAERLTLAAEHARMLVSHKGERLGVPQMRTQLGHYIGGIRGAAAMRRTLNQIKTLSELTGLLDAWRTEVQQYERDNQ